MPTTTRVFNFSAGPAVLPVPVLEEVQRDMLALPGVGMSILEISHRSRAFEDILAAAAADIRMLASVPDEYRILFLQGGASLQFSMVPMNLLPPDGIADYIVTGVWAQKAAKEAKKIGKMHVAASTESDNFTRIPGPSELSLTSGAAYVHMTSNNTIYGTQWSQPPDVGNVPLVCDASSDIFSRPIDVRRYGLIYAGAQKNLGPAGLTLVIIREDLLKRSSAALPTMLNYSVHAENGSLYNTPPVFAIYVMRLVLKWLLGKGGLDQIARENARKAQTLYTEIDRTGFYRGTAKPDSRSQMNVTFRLPSPELEKLFITQTTDAGLDGLKGHRSVGGVRVSIYNAFPEDGVETLVRFMRDFERAHG